MRLLPLLLIVLILVVVACRREPAYKDLPAGGSNNANTQAGAQPGASGESAAAPAETPQTETPPVVVQPPAVANANTAHRTANRYPSFLDPISGQIRDLPSYPRSTRANFQYGPMSGVDTALIVLQTSEPMEKLTAFYDKAVKSHGWTIVSNTRDPEHYRWELKKGPRDEAVVEIRKSDQFPLTGIALTRAERPEAK
jgi:hypothetical protein